jgi:hypothetical protein
VRAARARQATVIEVEVSQATQQFDFFGRRKAVAASTQKPPVLEELESDDSAIKSAIVAWLDKQK